MNENTCHKGKVPLDKIPIPPPVQYKPKFNELMRVASIFYQNYMTNVSFLLKF